MELPTKTKEVAPKSKLVNKIDEEKEREKKREKKH